MRDRKKGIVLITTMLLLSFIIMISTLLIVTGRSTLLLGASYSDREQAQYASECGLAYVQHCLTKFKDWKGPDDSTLESIYDPGLVDFKVEKIGSENRCIKGTLNNGNCEFYVAFYDGSWDASDLRKDRAAGGSNLKYYSINNLSNPSGNGQSMYYNGSTAIVFKTTPPLSAHIIVEGRCNQAKRYTEAILKNANTMTGSSGTLAGGNIEGNLLDTNSVFLVNSKASDSRIRSLGDIKISSGDANDKNCYQIANGGTSYTGVHDDSKHTYVNNKVNPVTNDNQGEYGIRINDKDDQSRFLDNDATRLTWDEVTGKYISGSDFNSDKVTTTIASGTWVYRQRSEGSNTYDLYYYSEKFAPGSVETFLNGKTGVKYSEYTGDPLISGITADGITISNPTISDMSTFSGSMLSVTKPVGVSGNNGFAFLVYDCVPDEAGKYQPSTTYRASLSVGGSSDPCLISNTGGDIYIGGELSGKGKIISGGELAFQGKSILKSDTGSYASIYAQKDITVNPIQGSGGVCDPNTAIKAAWDAVAGSGSGYYDTEMKSYRELGDKLLKTCITGTYGGVNYTSATSLQKVLCDSGGFGYDQANTVDLVSTMLAKNSYIGTGGSEGEKTVTLSFGGGKDGTFNINGYTITTTLNSLTGTATIKVYEQKMKVESSLPGGSSELLAMNETGDSAFVASRDRHRDNLIAISSSIQPIKIPPAESYTISRDEFTEGTDTLTDVTPHPEEKYDGYTGTVGITIGKIDITLSIKAGNWDVTYPTKGEPAADSIQMLKSGDDSFIPLVLNDTLLNGLIYSWENIKAPNVQGGSLSIRGGVIAFGGDPSSGSPGSNGGNITFEKAKTVTFTYDPDYLYPLYENVSGFDTTCIYKAFF